MKNFALEDLKEMLDADAPGESAEFANVTFRMADGMPVVAAYIHEEDGKKVITLSDVPADKRDPPKKGALKPEDALVYWITMLQTYAQYNGEVGMLMVKNYDADNSAPEDEDYTELDIWNDDPTNLTDGTWTEPILVTEDEDDD